MKRLAGADIYATIYLSLIDSSCALAFACPGPSVYWHMCYTAAIPLFHCWFDQPCQLEVLSLPRSFLLPADWFFTTQ